MNGDARVCPGCGFDLAPTVIRVTPDYFVRVLPKGAFWAYSTDGPADRERMSPVCYRCGACGKTFRMIAT